MYNYIQQICKHYKLKYENVMKIYLTINVISTHYLASPIL